MPQLSSNSPPYPEAAVHAYLPHPLSPPGNRRQGREEDEDPVFTFDAPIRERPQYQRRSISLRSRDSRMSEEPSLRIATLTPPLGQFVINTFLQIAAFAAAIAFGVFAVKSVTVGNDANRFAARALDEAVIANKLAMLAVCLATSNQTDATKGVCSTILAGAATVLPDAASNIYTTLPTFTTATSTSVSTTIASSSTYVSSSTSTRTSTVTATAAPIGSSPTPSKMSGGQINGLSAGAIAGIAVGSAVCVLLILAGIVLFVRRSRMARSSRPMAEAHHHHHHHSPPQPGDGARPSSWAGRTSTSGVDFDVDGQEEKVDVRERKGARNRFRELFMDSYVVTR